MDCVTFRHYWLSPDRNQITGDLRTQLINHFIECTACSDAELSYRLQQRGVDLAKYTCIHLAEYAEFYCEQHSNPFDCPDAIIAYDSKQNEYGIIHGDRASTIKINCCPWCGVKC